MGQRRNNKKKKKRKICSDKWKQKHNIPQLMKYKSVVNIYLNKEERSQINNLHLKELGKEEQTKSKNSRKKKIIKVGMEVNKREKVNKTKLFFKDK